MERNSTVKTILLTCAAVAAIASPAAAQTEASDGLRHLLPKDESKQNDYLNLIQSRAIEMGFFSWPIPTGKVAADQANRPRQVSSCKDHDPDYRPAHDFSGQDDPQMRISEQTKAFIYEWMAYDNAIRAKDCTCATLNADWPAAVSAFDALTEGVENYNLYTDVPIRMRDRIKRDYDRMCEINMLLELE